MIETAPAPAGAWPQATGMSRAGADDTNSDEARWSALMASAQRGNEADYRQLLGELSEVIERFLRSRIGHHHFVEDCVQETLVAIHKARHTYDPHRRFRPWFFAIVRHKAIDALRRQRSQNDMVERYREDVETNQHAHDAAGDEDRKLSGKLIDALSPQYRDAITLTKIHGLSTTEAAARLQITEGALKVRIHRAIGRLRRMVEAEAL